MVEYAVIPSEKDIIYFSGRGCKVQAINCARKLYLQGDLEVYVIRCNDNDPDGYCANSKPIFIKELVKEGEKR